MKVRIKKMHPDAVVPKYAHKGDSGFDFHALEDAHLLPGETKLVRTGLAFNVGEGYELQVRPRSGLSLKTPLRIANAPGTVDFSFTGEVCIIMTNTRAPFPFATETPFNLNTYFINLNTYFIKKGDRVAQGVICEVEQAEFEVVDELDSTDRGAGGFGSTGT